MEKVKLYTRDGRYVVTIIMPVFNPQAEAILWGQRVFVLRDGKYYEGLMWAADVNKEFEEIEKDDSLKQEAISVLEEVMAEHEIEMQKPRSRGLKPSKLGGLFDYGKQLPDGQFERHPTIPTEGVEFVQPLRHSYKHLKCGGVTTMGDGIARTYAAQPDFYTGTFCATCHAYFDFKNEDGHFVWIDEETKRDTSQRLGE